MRLKKYINLTFLDTVKLLGDLSKWIGDLVATKYMNLHVPNDGDKSKGQSILVGNGKRESTSMHVTIKGQMINKKGMEVGTTTLTDVAYSPSRQFNLCSLSRLMKMDEKYLAEDQMANGTYKLLEEWRSQRIITKYLR